MAGAKRVLVTGAGSGIGQAIVARLARAGHQVVATVRDQARAEQASRDAASQGLAVKYVALELTDSRSIESLAGRAEVSGGIDVLVHNAGFGVFGAVEDVGAEAAERQFHVNLFGPLDLTRRLLPGLRQRRGQIVWVGSLAGRIPLPFQAHYSASKAAIASVSDAMRMELAPHGVRVTCVEPSDFATGFTSSRSVVCVPGSAYSETAQRCLKEVERQETGAPNPDWVAKVVERLVANPAPPPRVPVGQNAGLICLLLRLLPMRLAERLTRSHYRV